jgi:signal peptidase II
VKATGSVFSLLVSVSVLVVLDQWSKRTVARRAASRSISCGRMLRIRYVPSPRGIYTRDRARAAFVLVWITALLCALVLHRIGWFPGSLALVGLGLALGGAAGNLLDILRWRHVVDFIDVRWWPAFNVADVAIVAGLGLALWARS